ncbi:MAG TPA: RcnB family protein [Ramlibacter sp.]|nr:RcnB family protein [Ramlibacter sp.]
MKSRNLVSSVTIATIAALGFGTVAQAQPSDHQWRSEQRQQRQEQRQQRQQQHQNVQPQYTQQQYTQQHQQQWQQRQQYQAPVYPQRNVAPQYNYQQQHVYNNYAPRHYAQPQYRSYGSYASYGSRYYVGGYAPMYASHRYWVNDWRARHLYAPPYGYQWVETDTGDVLLLALATGLIANAILAQ